MRSTSLLVEVEVDFERQTVRSRSAVASCVGGHIACLAPSQGVTGRPRTDPVGQED